MSPGTANVAVTANHTITIRVAGVGGTIDAGTYTATATIASGPGTPASQTCTYTEVTKSCTVVITSAANGTSVVHAKTTLSVGGQSITRETSTAVNTAAGGGLDAGKAWVDAKVSITPGSATNAVGTNHTPTI